MRTIDILPVKEGAMCEPSDITWIERLIAVGEELGGVDLPEIPDGDATAADLRTV